MSKPVCLGRLLSQDPQEALFFSINGERVKSYTDLKIRELRKIIETQSVCTKDFLDRFLKEVEEELDRKFSFDSETSHLKENIKAPIIFAYHEIVEKIREKTE